MKLCGRVILESALLFLHFFFSFFKIWNSWLTAFWKKNKTHKRLIGMLCNQTIPDNMVHIVQLKSIPFNLFLCFDLFALRTLLQTSVFQLVHWSWCASPHGLGAPYRSIIDYWSVAQWYHFLLAIARHPQSVLPSVWWGRERESKKPVWVVDDLWKEQGFNLVSGHLLSGCGHSACHRSGREARGK